MKSIREFIQEYPRPPAIPRGQRIQTTISFSNEEWELIRELTYHPDLRDCFEGHVSELVRWSVYHVAEDLLNVDVTKVRSLALSLRRSIREEAFELSLRSVDEWLTKVAREIDVFLWGGQEKAAFDAYELFKEGLSRFYPDHEDAIRRVSDRHPEFSRVYDQLHKLNPQRLQDIDMGW